MGECDGDDDGRWVGEGDGADGAGPDLRIGAERGGGECGVFASAVDATMRGGILETMAWRPTGEDGANPLFLKMPCGSLPFVEERYPWLAEASGAVRQRAFGEVSGESGEDGV